jgi:hypothetical protein
MERVSLDSAFCKRFPTPTLSPRSVTSNPEEVGATHLPALRTISSRSRSG